MNDIPKMRESVRQRLGLRQLIRTIPNKDLVIEIGSYAGESTRAFARAFARVIAIDRWKGSYTQRKTKRKAALKDVRQVFIEEVIKKYHNISMLHMPSAQASTIIANGYANLIYIDANHSYEGVKSDIIHWSDKVAPNCWIGGHDYGNDNFPGIKQAVDELLGEPDKVFRDTSWLKKL